MRAQRRVFRHASGRGPARPWWASPLFRVEDEGDDRNYARVAHARPIVAQNHASWPCGQMLPRRRDRAGTGRWRSMGGSRSSALPALRSRPCLPPSPIQGKFRAAKWATLPPSAVAAPLSSAPPAPPPTACVGVRGVRETARETASLRKGASAAFNTHRKAISQQPRYYIPIRDT